TGCIEVRNINHEPDALPVGRFQLVQLGKFRSDQLLLDTSTGKTWRSVCALSSKGSNCPTVWAPEPVIDLPTISKPLSESHRKRRTLEEIQRLNNKNRGRSIESKIKLSQLCPKTERKR